MRDADSDTVYRYPFAGYRRWKCFSDPENMELFGVTDPYHWNFEVNKATCIFSASPYAPEKHEAPGEDCGCGFYGYYSHQKPDLEFARLYPWYHMPSRGYMLVTRLIAGWGRVWEHQYAFRAEKAKIMALLKPKPNRKVMKDWALM